MKVATIAVIAATSFAIVHGADCDASKIAKALPTADQAKCKTESGFDITASAPTTAILTKFCKSETCTGLYKSLKTLALAECTINNKQLYKEILDPAEAACKAAATPSPAATTPSNSTKTTTAPSNSTAKIPTSASNSTAKTPATTTAAKTPATSTAAKTPATTTAAKTPSTTTAAKTPTATTSGASMLTLTAGAVVLTIAAAMV